MNKLISCLMVAMLALAMVVTVGCEESSSPSTPASIVGTWTLTEAFLGNISLAAILSQYDASISTTVEFRSDNTFTATGAATAAEIDNQSGSANGQWETSGNTLTLTAEGVTVPMAYEMNGDSMTLTVSSSIISHWLTLFAGELDAETVQLINLVVTGQELLVELDRQ
jgi:hypothetical protein